VTTSTTSSPATPAAGVDIATQLVASGPDGVTAAGGTRVAGAVGWQGLLIWLPGLLVGVGAIAATAHGLYEVALAARVPPGIAWLYPLITDGLALVAYAATARLTGSARRYAWAVVLVAAGLSGLAQASLLASDPAPPPAPALPASALPAGTHEQASAFVASAPLRFGVGAWPAIAAAVAAHLLYLLADTTSDRRRAHGRRDGATAEPPLPAGDETRQASRAAALSVSGHPGPRPSGCTAVHSGAESESYTSAASTPPSTPADAAHAEAAAAERPPVSPSGPSDPVFSRVAPGQPRPLVGSAGSGRGRPLRGTPSATAHSRRSRSSWNSPRSPAAPQARSSRRCASSRRPCTWSPTPHSQAVTGAPHDRLAPTHPVISDPRQAEPETDPAIPEHHLPALRPTRHPAQNGRKSRKIKSGTPMHHDPTGWARLRPAATGAPRG
jgi:hypothetical protein